MTNQLDILEEGKTYYVTMKVDKEFISDLLITNTKEWRESLGSDYNLISYRINE